LSKQHTSSHRLGREAADPIVPRDRFLSGPALGQARAGGRAGLAAFLGATLLGAAVILFALALPTSASESGLTLQAAIEAALGASPELSLARLRVREAELSLLAAEVEAGQSTRFEYLQAQRELEAAHRALLDAAAAVTLRAEEAFYRALRAQDLLELRQRAADEAGARAGVAQARFDAGTLPRIDLLEIELAAETAAARLDDARRELEAALHSLSELTGLFPLPPLQWSEEERAFTPLEVDLEAATVRALDAHGDVAAARIALESAERRLESERLSGSPPVALLRAEIEVERAGIRLAEAQARARQEVRQSYDALKTAAGEVSLKEKALSLELLRLEVARARYAAGTIALSELHAAETRAVEARVDAAMALWEYNLQKARFLRLTGEASKGAPAPAL